MNIEPIIKLVISSSIVLIIIIMGTVFVVHEIPQNNRELIINMMGIVEGAFISLVGFYFGSSEGSKDKTNIIKNSVQLDKYE